MFVIIKKREIVGTKCV